MNRDLWIDFGQIGKKVSLNNNLAQLTNNLIVLMFMLFFAGSAFGLNSEEHANVIDYGVSEYIGKRPDVERLLSGAGLNIEQGDKNYAKRIACAKLFATGTISGGMTKIGESPTGAVYAKNISAGTDYDSGYEGDLENEELDMNSDIEKGRGLDIYSSEFEDWCYSRHDQEDDIVSQDQCFSSTSGFLQSSYNRNIVIPDVKKRPKSTLEIGSYSVGELGALYGDYRRSTYCENGSNCYITPGDRSKVLFRGTSPFCPTPVKISIYLKDIASGLVPPIGKLGNTLSNSAHLEGYYEAGWWGDEMLRLANVNDWHFSNGAIAWYVGLHRLALYSMAKAIEQPEYMIQALHFEANALHAYVDLFSFGHIVTNRGETSYGIIQSENLLEHRAFKWSESVLAMGGGSRNKKGQIQLSSGSLAKIPQSDEDIPSPGRNDSMPSYRGLWAQRAYFEENSHTTMNKAGAVVRNLNGKQFQIYGDGLLEKMPDTFDLISQGVGKSLDSLFEFYWQLKSQQATLDDLDDRRELASYFGALKFLPVYIKKDGRSYFRGRWALYAGFIDELTNSEIVPEDWENCKIAFLSGKNYFWPPKSKVTCTKFPLTLDENDSKSPAVPVPDDTPKNLDNKGRDLPQKNLKTPNTLPLEPIQDLPIQEPEAAAPAA